MYFVYLVPGTGIVYQIFMKILSLHAVAMTRVRVRERAPCLNLLLCLLYVLIFVPGALTWPRSV